MKQINDIKLFEKCDRLLWNTYHDPLIQPQYTFYNEDINELGIQRLGYSSSFVGAMEDDNQVFFSLESTHEIFRDVYFTFCDLSIKMDIMVATPLGYDVYFTFPTCYPKEGEAQGIADKLWVLHNLKVKVNNMYIMHLDADYVRGETYNLNQMIRITTYLYNAHHKPGRMLRVLAPKRLRNLRKILHKIDACTHKQEVEAKRTLKCTKKNKCPYLERCFPNQEDSSIYNLSSSAHKFEFIKQGIRNISDIDFSQLEGTRMQYAQWMAIQTKQLFYDSVAMDTFLSKVSYPLSFLDFEWESFAFPAYIGMKPNDVLTFQYSLHIEPQSMKPLIHYEYLGSGDCRIAFLDSLLEHLPSSGTIFCFNVEGAEKLRLLQLAQYYPAYAKRIQDVCKRMYDLALPFCSGVIYDEKMAGVYALKKLVTTFSSYSYDDLEISNGGELVEGYLNMLKLGHNETLRQNMLNYCAMDTYAMYLIYHWMLKQQAKALKEISNHA